MNFFTLRPFVEGCPMKTLIGIPLFALALSVHAETTDLFTGAFSVANWTVSLQGGVVNLSAAPLSVLLVSADDDSGPSEQSLNIGATSYGLVSFGWTYESDDIAPVFDAFGYTVNGLFFPVSVDTDPLLQAGSTSFAVAAGDIFGFSQQSFDSSGGAARTTVGSFRFEALPPPIPEPGAAALLLLGLPVVWALRQRRSHA